MMLKVMAKWSEFTRRFWDESFKLLMISSDLDRTRSKSSGGFRGGKGGANAPPFGG